MPLVVAAPLALKPLALVLFKKEANPVGFKTGLSEPPA